MSEKLRVVAVARDYHPHSRDECELETRTAVFDADTSAETILKWAWSGGALFGRSRVSVTLHFDDSQKEIVEKIKEGERNRFFENIGKDDPFSTVNTDHDIPL